MNSQGDDSRIDIRTKPAKSTAAMSEKTRTEVMPVSPELIQDDLKAATVQMEYIDSIPSKQFKLKEQLPRSPAPMPMAISPAGVPINIETSTIPSLPSSPRSAKSRGEFKIDLGNIEAIDELDMTINGKESMEYERNVKGSVVVVMLLLISLHLFLEHLTIFSWIINFDSPQSVVAGVLYIISTLFIISVFIASLVVPSMSIQDDKLVVYYSPILAACIIDQFAISFGGGLFSPLTLYTQDSMNYATYDGMAGFFNILVNSLLYILFTRKESSGKIFDLVHPFRRKVEIYQDEEIIANEAKAAIEEV